MPSGKWAPIPANTGAVRELRHSDQGMAQTSGNYRCRWKLWSSCYDAKLMEWSIIHQCLRERRNVAGYAELGSKWTCLSVNKGTREAQSSMAVSRISLIIQAESLPMRRLSGGASVVVRGRESRSHGEGRQDNSFCIKETLTQIGRVPNER